MTIQRRLLIWLLAISAVLWALTSTIVYLTSRHEINELFDTQQLRLAEQALATAAALSPGAPGLAPAAGPRSVVVHRGHADPKDLSVSLWRGDGSLLWRSDGEVELPYSREAIGFENVRIAQRDWIVYHLHSDDGLRVVSVGQRASERDQLLRAQLASQILPWVLVLPILGIAIWATLRTGFRPLRELATTIAQRSARELQPIPSERAPPDVRPLVDAMNLLFARIEAALHFERRLTADAAHELRTPLAALRAQWDAAHLATDTNAREHAFRRIGEGIERLSRLVGQLLSLSALEAGQSERFDTPIDWHRVIETVLSESLPMIDSQQGEIDVLWPSGDAAPFPLLGSEALLATMLRNLIDNALRYGGEKPRITIRIATDSIELADSGPGLPPEVRARLGERFVRPPGQEAAGSGIGISIVLRIAALHGLKLTFVDASPGLRVGITR